MDRGRIQRFQIVRTLGAGGRGTVYRAHDPQLARDVALKVLQRTEAPRDDTWARTVDLRAPSNDELLAEARAMAQLAHPNVLPVFEVGEHEGAVFIVMELVEGTDLRTWLDGAPPGAAILDTFAQAGRGLAAAHARGVVHRDFKPENVLIGSDGRVRVADFGLSSVAPRQDALRRIADASGTPEYMAPELAHERASQASDVFAFVMSLAEALLGRHPGGARGDALATALREAGVSSPLVALVVAGVAGEPAARPPLAPLIDALAGPALPKRRGRTIGAVLAVAALGGAGVAYVAWPREAAPVCEVDRALLDRHWSLARRTAIVHTHGEAAPAMVAALDHLGEVVAAERARACRANVRGELADAQLRVWRGCLDRRAIAIGALAERVAKQETAGVELAAQLTFAPSCVEVTAPPSTDLDRYAALVLRNLLAGTLPLAERPLRHAAILHDAEAAGEIELAIRSELDLGDARRLTDQYGAADASYKHAHERAMNVHAFDLAASALVSRASLAMSRGDADGGRPLSELAWELADRPTVSPSVRATALAVAARVEFKAGNFVKAATGYAKARAALADGGASPRVELPMRLNQARAMIWGGREADALALARETVDFARTRIGETSSELGDAYDVLGLALRHAGKSADSVEVRKQALAILAKRYPPDHSRVLQVRATLATELADAGNFAAARDEMRMALAAAEHNEALRPRYAFYLRALGEAEFNLGNHAEGMRLIERAIEEATSSSGQDHPATQHARLQYITFALALERLDDAEAMLARAGRGYRKQPPEDKRELVVLEGTHGAALALARGRPGEAAAAARAGIAALAELKLDRSQDAAWMHHTLARALVAARDWRGALAAAQVARDLGKEHAIREDMRALFELPFAEAAAALGQQAEARSVLAAARAVLARYPGQPRGQKHAAKLSRR